ncbi:hypothetical protein CWATWH0005_1461 [Crocosphaera watsonii WH 0005]|uniref:Uncharacterized protein n=1 Tax=Crocosphaera watsonii WH 0005 TaxID=423472 RepID=T2IWP6_CROWT|nr:hypothetical protein CWATWH0005_1461 [Crocosphaera watsonii WH 0005]
MSEIEQVIEDYVLGWNSSKPEDRLLLMKKSFGRKLSLSRFSST